MLLVPPGRIAQRGDVVQLVESDSKVSVSRPDVPQVMAVIGANTGGPQALSGFLPQFPSDFPATILVVQQMRPGFTRVLAQQLGVLCQLPVSELSDGQAVLAGRIYVAPSASRVSIRREDYSDLPGYSFVSDYTLDTPHSAGPIDCAMRSAAEVFGPGCIGVLLTGVGTDGRDGMRAVTEGGGVTVAQDEESSVVYDLPRSAMESGSVQQVLPLWSIADYLMQVVRRESDAAVA